MPWLKGYSLPVVPPHLEARGRLLAGQMAAAGGMRGEMGDRGGGFGESALPGGGTGGRTGGRGVLAPLPSQVAGCSSKAMAKILGYLNCRIRLWRGGEVFLVLKVPNGGRVSGGGVWAREEARPPRISGRLGAASLPDGLDLAQRQQALRRDALVGHDAEEFAGWLGSVVGENREVAFGGEGLAQLPLADRADGEAQVGGNLLQGDLVPPAPVFERNREAGADVTLEFWLFGHRGSLGGHLDGKQVRGEGLGSVSSDQ